MDQTTGNLYGGSVGYQDENSPDWRLQHLPAPPVSVLVTSSKVGERTYGGTLHFVSLVKPADAACTRCTWRRAATTSRPGAASCRRR